MNKSRLFGAFLVVSLAFLAALSFALPATCAYADEDDSDAETTVLNQQLFTDAGGVYTISEPGTYELEESVEGALIVDVPGTGNVVNIHLNGHAITNPTTSGNGVLTVRSRTTITVTGGDLEQKNESYSVVRTNINGLRLILQNVNVSGTNHTCIDAAGGTVVIQGGTYSLTITKESAKEEAILTLANGNCQIAVGSGQFTLDTPYDDRIIVKDVHSAFNVNNCITLSGGDWSAFPEQATLPKGMEGIAMLARKSDNEDGSIGCYSVLETGQAKRAAVCYLKTNTRFKNIYFESRADAVAWAKAHGLDPDTSIVDVFKITFDTDGAVDSEGESIQSWTADVYYGETVDDPALALNKKGYFFEGWVNPDEAQAYPTYDFTRKVYSGFTLKPIWGRAQASIGDTYYKTLQEAIDAAEDGQTVCLCDDVDTGVTISGKKITLDLASYTLSGSVGDTLTIKDGADVRVQNGAVATSAAGSDKVSADAISVQNSTVMLVDVNASAGERSFCALSVNGDEDGHNASVTIEGGSYTAIGMYAIEAFEHATITVEGGVFTSSSTSEKHMPSAFVAFSSSMFVEDGTFEEGFEVWNRCTLSIRGGNFAWPNCASYLEEGKFLFKEKDGYYKPAAYDSFIASANYVAYDESGSIKVYFADGQEAEDFVQTWLEGHGTVKEIYHVRIVERGNEVETRHLEQGSALGELPQAAQVDGYDFDGWYVGTTKVDANYVPSASVDVVAMWVASGSGSADKPDSGSADKPDSGQSGTSLPQTGDVSSIAGVLASAAALAGLGAAFARRRGI